MLQIIEQNIKANAVQANAVHFATFYKMDKKLRSICSINCKMSGDAIKRKKKKKQCNPDQRES